MPNGQKIQGILPKGFLEARMIIKAPKAKKKGTYIPTLTSIPKFKIDLHVLQKKSAKTSQAIQFYVTNRMIPKRWVGHLKTTFDFGSRFHSPGPKKVTIAEWPGIDYYQHSWLENPYV